MKRNRDKTIIVGMIMIACYVFDGRSVIRTSQTPKQKQLLVWGYKYFAYRPIFFIFTLK